MTSSKDVVFLRVANSKVDTGCKMPVQHNIDVFITPFCQFIGDVSRNILFDFSSVTMEHIKVITVDVSNSVACGNYELRKCKNLRQCMEGLSCVIVVSAVGSWRLVMHDVSAMLRQWIMHGVSGDGSWEWVMCVVSAATSWKWAVRVLFCWIVAMNNTRVRRSAGSFVDVIVLDIDMPSSAKATTFCSRSNSPGSAQEIFLKGYLEVPLVQGLARVPRPSPATPRPFPSLVEGPRAPPLIYWEASARLLIRVLGVTPRRKQATPLNKTTPLNEVSDLNKEKPKRPCIPSSKSKDDSLQSERSEK
ncbi:hypothetical protein AVEN_117214-1 [Araneus ventricosus]|uniref:Uncharacterized protein n=1 Tax=Araneus ventricosus TaxID=182803 RepID=A0A4Y2AXJ9_ARAVE|nr:hypothetical protein AVEN_117214-1 [Araneus ventricosus]